MARHHRSHRRAFRKRPSRRKQRQRGNYAPIGQVNIWLALAGVLFWFLSKFLD